jgi:hypothetical protein
MPQATEVTWDKAWWTLDYIVRHFEELHEMTGVTADVKWRVRALRSAALALQQPPEPAVILTLLPGSRSTEESEVVPDGSKLVGCNTTTA